MAFGDEVIDAAGALGDDSDGKIRIADAPGDDFDGGIAGDRDTGATERGAAEEVIGGADTLGNDSGGKIARD